MTTAVLLGLTLAFEPVRRGVMLRPPRPPAATVLDAGLIRRIVPRFRAPLAAPSDSSPSPGAGPQPRRSPYRGGQCLRPGETFYLFSCRSLTRRFWSLGLFSNPWLWAGVGLMLGLQLLLTYWPPCHAVFKTAPSTSPPGWKFHRRLDRLTLHRAGEKYLSRRLGQLTAFHVKPRVWKPGRSCDNFPCPPENPMSHFKHHVFLLQPARPRRDLLQRPRRRRVQAYARTASPSSNEGPRQGPHQQGGLPGSAAITGRSWSFIPKPSNFPCRQGRRGGNHPGTPGPRPRRVERLKYESPGRKISDRRPAGKIDVIMETPDAPRASRWSPTHPPLGGGASTNKVAYTLARTFVSLGYASFRPTSRGVGDTEGVHDEAMAKPNLLAVLQDAKCRCGNLPVAWPAFPSAPSARPAWPSA